MAGGLDGEGAGEQRDDAAPRVVGDRDIGLRHARDDQDRGPDRRHQPLPAHQRAFSQSNSGVQHSSRARPLTTMPIWPSGKSSRVAFFSPRLGSTSAAADKGGTMRSPDGIMTSAGRLIFDGTIFLPPTTHRFVPDRTRERRAAVDPVLQQHELAGVCAGRVHAEEAAELLDRKPRIERPEQGLQHVDRQFARGICELGQHRSRRQQEGVTGLVGMEVPGSCQQGQARDPTRPARGECHGQGAAHAIAHHRRRPARPLAYEPQRAFETRDIGRAVETALLFARRAPVDYIRPQTGRSHCAQQALFGRKVEHFPAVDQRRHDKHGAHLAPARRTMCRAKVEQARGAFAPHNGRIFQIALHRMAAIGQYAFGQATQPPADLALQGGRETLGVDRRDVLQDVSERRALIRALRVGLRETPRAF